MLDCAYRLSSSWAYFSEECERLKSVFSRLTYPQHLINSTINTFVNSRVADQQSPQASTEMVENVTRVVIPFKNQDSANIVKTQLKDLKRPSHVKLMLANSCWKTQIGVCERHNNMLANCWPQIELVPILANSLPTCCMHGYT